MNIMSLKERKELMETALGNLPADKVLLGGILVNVHTLEVYPADVAVKNGRIAYVGDVSHTIGPHTEKLDVSGKYLLPGLIESHMHVGASQLSMTEFGKLALTRGTVCVTSGLFEVAVVAGKEGLRFCLDELKATGIKPVFAVPLPAYHQNEAFLKNGELIRDHLGTFTFEDAMETLEWPDCYGLNEVNLYNILAGPDEELGALIQKCQELGKLCNVHGARLNGRGLQAALAFAGRSAEHESASFEDAYEEARLGLTVQLRDGAVSCIKEVCERACENMDLLGDFAYCTDEIAPDKMSREGHMDLKLRLSIQGGADPVRCIRAASLNAARALRLDGEIGSIVPGKCADIVTVSSLKEIDVDMVMADGRVLVKGGKYIKECKAPAYPAYLGKTMRMAPVGPADVKVPAPEKDKVKVRVIRTSDGSLFSKEEIVEMTPVDGELSADPSRDILKLIQFDRHSRSGRRGVGFIRGFGIKDGAIASSYNPRNSYLDVMGTNDEDIITAANYLIEKGGGLCVVRNGRVVEALELPIAGILADAPYDEVSRKLQALNEAVADMGCVIENTFHNMAFMTFPTVYGKLKVSTYGLVDVDQGKVVDLIAE